jgi:hypothetical protein
MQISELHKVAQVKFAEFEQFSVLPIIKMLDEFYDKYKCNFLHNMLWQYWSAPDSTYENDGTTKCAGTRYHALCSVTIARPLGDAWEEKHQWYHGHSHSVINFHSEIQLRDNDSKIKYSSCSLKISPYIINPDVRENSTRINYTTHDSKMEFYKNESDMLRLLVLVNENFEMQSLHVKLKLLTPMIT